MKKLNSNPETPPKLKRFLAFYGNDYPIGGWNDFFGDFSSIEEAKDKIIKNHNEYWKTDQWENSSWAQIFDTQTQKILWTEQNN